MQSEKLKHFRERLLDERRQLVRDTEGILESISEKVHPPGEHEIAPSDAIDVEISLEQREGTRLRKVDAALARIHEGTFGRCCNCGVEIPQLRLEAVPDAMYCTRCETKLGRG